MKKINKYYWLAICSIALYLTFGFVNITNESRKSSSYKRVYPLQVIDNEIRYKDQVLYRFIPVDGGSMEFTYRTTRIQRDAIDSIEDTVEVYNSVREEIPSMLIGETPVTINLWAFVMENKIASEGSSYLYQTVYVSDKTKKEWMDFIDRLNNLTGCEFDLPTSNQWEYAARGGQKSKNYIYSGSNDINEVAQYKENVRSERFLLGKEKAPNELGIYDMSGSVFELTSTPFSDTDAMVKAMMDAGMGSDFLNNGNISRGGSFKSSAEECETRYRLNGVTMKTGARLLLKY